MMNTPVPGLVPSPAPQEAALHPQAVQVRADQPADPHAILGAFEQLLGGYAAGAGAESVETAEPIALVVGTSGSTGTPKRTALTARALAASATATENFFGSNSDAASQWLLALPAHYIAGAQVLARSVLAGTAPVIARSVLAGTTPVIARSVTEPVHFSPEVFLQAVERMSSARRFVSLVPTQLHKLLESADANPSLGAEIHEALGSFTGILLGGAPASADLLAAAQELGLNVVTTYGSAETAGGCVYSGAVLPGVRVELVPEEGMPAVPDIEGKPAQVGRIWISGAHLASGYIGDATRTAEHFFTAADGTRWYRTDDYGLLSPTHDPDSAAHGNAPRLQVLGRSDDVLISGGVKISARAVATVLEEHPAVREACVIGLPDARWGTAIAAAVTLVPSAGAAAAPTENGPALNEELCVLLRAHCAEKLGAPAAPKQLSILPDFPLTSTGKPDRAEIYSILDRDYRQG